MDLSNEQKCKLFTGGTVSIPALFPNLAIIRIEKDGMWLGGENDPKQDLLHIEESVDGKTIKRVLLLERAAAIFVPTDAQKPDMNDGKWLFGPMITADNLKAAQTDTNPPKVAGSQADVDYVHGIVCVLETQSMMVSMEVGLVAGEEADFLKAHDMFRCRCN